MGHKPEPSKIRQETPPEPAQRAAVNVVEPSRCKTCGSIERGPYGNIRRLPYAGVTPDGRVYTTVVWRRTKCKQCGQVRDDKSFE